MANNDKVSGTLQSIRDGKISFTTSYAKLEIPMPRVSQIELAAEKSTPPPPHPSDVRAFFADRGSITLVLENWNDQQVVGSGPAFGRLKFAPSAFRLIQFNLARQKPEAQDVGASDDVHEGQEIDTTN